MPKEEGVVLKIVPEGAVVCVKKTDACQGCPSAKLCHMGHSGERQVLARNPVGAKQGQRVEIEIRDGLLLKASFVVYMLPIMGLILGAIVGRWMIDFFQIPFAHDTGAVIGGLTSMFTVFILIKIGSKGTYYMKKYQPVIRKIK